MSPFDDDFFGGGFEELFNRLAGDGFVEYSSIDPDGKKRVIRRGKRNVLGKMFLNKVITEKRIYYIFELANRENIKARIKEGIHETKIIEVKENGETLFEFQLEETETEDFKYNFKNGILEVSYKQ